MKEIIVEEKQVYDNQDLEQKHIKFLDDFHKIKCGIESGTAHDEFYVSLQRLVDIVKSLKQEIEELKKKNK